MDLNDPEVLELYSYLLLFRGDSNSNEIAFPTSFSIKERKTVHLIADRLGLAHYSEGYGSDRQVIVEKKGTVPAPIVRVSLVQWLIGTFAHKLSNSFKIKDQEEI